jgi:hypothetical protein
MKNQTLRQDFLGRGGRVPLLIEMKSRFDGDQRLTQSRPGSFGLPRATDPGQEPSAWIPWLSEPNGKVQVWAAGNMT